MKNLLMLLFVSLSFAAVSNAQAVEHKTKVKRTSTVPQKVHNVFHPKHKKHSGYKIKHEAKKD